MSRVRAIKPWTAVVLAAFVAVAVGACGSSASSSASSSPSAPPTTASAPAPAGSGTQTSALCQDLSSLHHTATSFAHLKPSTATANTVSADVQLMGTELNSVSRDAHGKFTPQVNALRSSLATLRSKLTGVSQGKASVSSVTTAAKNVKTRADGLAAAAKNACPSVASSSS